MKRRRVLHLVLALLLVVSIAPCGLFAQTSAPLEKYKQPITISWGIQTAAASKLLDKDTWEDNRWSRLIKDKLNINLTVAFSADSSTTAYQTKLNAVIASGDLPDIFKTQDMNVFMQLVQAGQLADLTDVYNKYATDTVKTYQTRFADAFKGATIDGKLYAIPRMNDNFHEAPFLWIRDDWLKNTNSQAPKTVDQMVALAKKFATGDPGRTGKNGNAFGLALNKDLIRQNHASILGLVSAFGVPGRDETTFYRGKDGKITFAWIQPGMKPALKLLHDMYVQGLINKEFTAKNESALLEDWTNGKIGMAYGSNWGTWYPYNYVYKKDGVITRAYPIPTQPGYDYKVGIESNATGQMTLVSKKCKNPEAAIKILSLYDQVVNRQSTDDFNRYWADEQYRLCPVYIDIANEVYEKDLLAAYAKGSSASLDPFARQFYDYVVGFENGTLAKNDNAYGTWGQMSKNGSLQIVLNRYQPDNAVVQSILGILRPDVWLTNVSVLDTLTITTFTDIITGAKPVEYFDTFVQQWLKAGGQQTLNEMERLYPAK
ncbi:MAG: extracellular solute-binding protein [Spirochaetia bacterium]|jgi:putative aldouronate transport system substrate-binding protein